MNKRINFFPGWNDTLESEEPYITTTKQEG